MKKTVELLNFMIEPEGFEVIKAYGGKEGLEKLFSQRQPDILILDLMMPEVSGFDIISSLRADVRTEIFLSLYVLLENLLRRILMN